MSADRFLSVSVDPPEVQAATHAGGPLQLLPVRQRPPAHEAGVATAASILTAAGAEEVITIDSYAHLVGGARIGDRPETGVADGDLSGFAERNLWITDGSTRPIQGAANPALTIMARWWHGALT